MSAFAAEPFDDKFRQLDELLPTPTTIRTASGAPGQAYWQQRADYAIRATLDEGKRSISGAETITYHNNSPDTLTYLWVQLDQNMFRGDSDNRTIATLPSRDAWQKARPGRREVRRDPLRLREPPLRRRLPGRQRQGRGRPPLHYVINKTMMRIDLPQPMKPGARFSFALEWSFNIPEAQRAGPPHRATSASTKTRTTCSKSPSGSRAWRPTTTSPAGRTSSTSATASSRSNSATTMSR
jgi:hypothetical protein